MIPINIQYVILRVIVYHIDIPCTITPGSIAHKICLIITIVIYVNCSTTK